MFKFSRGELYIVFATLFAALGWIASKSALVGMAPAEFVGTRFLIAGFALLPLCFKKLLGLSVKEIFIALGLGMVMGLCMLLWIHAVQISERLGEGAFIMSLSMLFAPLVAKLLFKQPVPSAFWRSVPFAAAGLGLLSLANGWQFAADQLWFLSAAALLSLHFNLNQQLASRISALPLVCLQVIGAGLLSLGYSVIAETWPANPGEDVLIWLLISALLSTSLRFVLQTSGQKMISTANAAAIMVLEPVWALLMSYVWLNEAVSLQKLAGCGLILFSLLLYRKLQVRRQKSLTTTAT